MMLFEKFGELDWLEPSEFYADSWNTLSVEVGEDGEVYEIVISSDGNLRYTNI